MKAPPKPEVMTLDDQRAMLDAKTDSERIVILAHVADREYEHGWSDADKEWTAYVDLLEKPAAQA